MVYLNLTLAGILNQVSLYFPERCGFCGTTEFESFISFHTSQPVAVNKRASVNIRIGFCDACARELALILYGPGGEERLSNMSRMSLYKKAQSAFNKYNGMEYDPSFLERLFGCIGARSPERFNGQIPSVNPGTIKAHSLWEEVFIRDNPGFAKKTFC